MRILIISAEVWRDNTNGGNVLSSIFRNSKNTFFQIYCNPGKPENDICQNYLQITESTALKSLFKRKDPFYAFSLENKLTNHPIESDKLKTRFKSFKTPIFYLAREVLFSSARWKKSFALHEFIKKANPDIIFAPSYASPFLLKLASYIANLTKKHVVSYVSDDNYSLKQISISPFYWMNRFWIRSMTRRFYKKVDLMYTMTESQKNELHSDFPYLRVKILTKDALSLPVLHSEYRVNNPRFIYAGGIYLKRYNNLIYIQKILNTLYDGKAHIDIFTDCSSKAIMKKLEKSGCKVHCTIAYDELCKEYQRHDVAIHTESFNKKYAFKTRLSFSTKIIDCMASGCALIAFLPKNNAGLSFLNKNKLGFCSSTKADLFKTLDFLKNHQNSIAECASSLVDYCKENHWAIRSSEIIETDFKELLNR